MNEKIVKIANEVRMEYGKNDWVEVSKRLARIYGVVMSADACRKRAKRSGMEVEETYADQVKIERKADGTQISERIILMSETDMKDDVFILKAHGFDPEIFSIVNVQSTMWKVQTKEKDLHNYHSKLTVKMKQPDEFTKEDLLSALIELKDVKFDKDIKLIKFDKDGYVLEVDWADLHIGSLSWHGEVGADNDYKIAFGSVVRIVSKIVEILKTGKVKKIINVFLGDGLHIDTEAMTTTKGTKVDFDSRPRKMIMKAFEMFTYIIDNTAIVPMEVKWVGGNHSELIEFSIFWSLPMIYKGNKNIDFDVTPKQRKILQIGEVLIGLLHGHNIDKKELNTWLQYEFREEWGKAKYAELHSGHFHTEIITDEIGGITKRTNPTLKLIDKYEYDHGWFSKKVVLAYLWHETEHLKEIYYLK